MLTIEQENIVAMYHQKTRAATITAIEEAIKQLTFTEDHLIFQKALISLEKMTDFEFDNTIFVLAK